ncbi:MAG: hypothetical protein CMM93_07950 [Rickettsiales bacterium]|nr:hypothetical protein [Rickettsiales bacterium]|tara:strand:- start:425 stop:688 length:264 start_codon:yes stop_codon:yes gene_type:complete
MNKLDEFIKRLGLTVKEFADEHGFTRGMVYDWIAGRRRPSGPNMDYLYEISDGFLTANDFYHGKVVNSPRKRGELASNLTSSDGVRL